MRRIHALVALVLLAFAPPLRAQETAIDPRTETIAVADAYMAAYQELDEAALAGFYADDARFFDPTSYDMPGFAAPFDFQGRDAILAGIASFKTDYGLVRVPYAVTTKIAGMHDVAYIGEVQSEVRVQGEIQRYAYPIVTIIRVAGGKVIEHRDYVDYPAGRPITP